MSRYRRALKDIMKRLTMSYIVLVLIPVLRYVRGVLYPFPQTYTVCGLCSRRLLQTLGRKDKLLTKSSFSFTFQLRLDIHEHFCILSNFLRVGKD